MTTPTVTAAKEAPRASSRCTVPAVTTCPRKSPAQTNSAGGQKAQGKQTGKAACSAGGGGNAGRGKEGVREANEWHQANSSGTSEQLQTSSRQDTALQWLHALTELSSCPAQSRMERPGGLGACLSSSTSSSTAGQDPGAGSQGAHYLVRRGEHLPSRPLQRAGACGEAMTAGARGGHKLSVSKARLFYPQQRQQGRGAAAFSDLCSLATVSLPARDCI